MNQYLRLKWNNHQSTLVSVLNTLLQDEKLIDVTLSAEGQMIGAHRVVLSACSNYFEHIFSSCGDKHPVIILKDVKFEDLKSLVDFMYHGELNVSEAQFSDLVKTASSLKIKGLFNGQDGNSAHELADREMSRNEFCRNDESDKGTNSLYTHVPDEVALQDGPLHVTDEPVVFLENTVCNVKIEPSYSDIEGEEIDFDVNDVGNSNSLNEMEMSPSFSDNSGNSNQKNFNCDDFLVNSKFPLEIQRWTCERCGRRYKNRPTLTRHLKLECGVVPKFKCPLCIKPFKRREHVREHLQFVHKIQTHPIDCKSN